MKLLLHSLFAAVVLLGAYYVLLRVVPSSVAVPQGINQDNVIKMQEHLYATNGRCATVILGSSLAAKLRAQALPPGTCNLALRGQSVFEGFELMRRAGDKPTLILLEINVLDRAPNRGTIEDIFSPALHPLRRWYPGLQARHQPLNEALAGGLTALEHLRPAAAQHIEEKLGVGQPLAAGATPPADEAEAQAPSAAVVALAHAEDDQLPQAPAFEHNLTLLRHYISYFRARGSRVVFFEMPTDAYACQGAKMRYIRQRLATLYPAGQLTYLPRPDCTTYHTTDGEHLTDPSALRYSMVLAQELQSLPPAPPTGAVARLRYQP